MKSASSVVGDTECWMISYFFCECSSVWIVSDRVLTDRAIWNDSDGADVWNCGWDVDSVLIVRAIRIDSAGVEVWICGCEDDSIFTDISILIRCNPVESSNGDDVCTDLIENKTTNNNTTNPITIETLLIFFFHQLIDSITSLDPSVCVAISWVRLPIIFDGQMKLKPLHKNGFLFECTDTVSNADSYELLLLIDIFISWINERNLCAFDIFFHHDCLSRFLCLRCNFLGSITNYIW